MINYPSGWFAILHTSEIKRNKPIPVYRFGINLVIWRDANHDVVVMEDRCPHRSARLSLGKICDGNITCPFHGFQFANDGSCQLAPEFGRAIPKLKVKTFQSIVRVDMLWIFVGDGDVTDFDIDVLEQMHSEFSAKYSIFTKTWRANITRCIENQLDYTHLPNVHRSTIGRNFIIPENPRFEQKSNNIYSYFSTDTSSKPSTIFIFPNAWILNISPSFQLVMYFVALDDDNTKLYLVSYRKFLTNKIIKKVIDMVVNISNKIILNQDQKVVESQSLKFNTSDEMLMKHDAAIRMFRDIWDSK